MREEQEPDQHMKADKRVMKMLTDPGHEDIIRFLINPQQEIHDRIMALQGYEWDVMENTWIDSTNRLPKMNQEGINFVITELNHIMNKFIPQSNLTSKQVENYILSYSSRIRTGLVQNAERFKIHNLSDLTQIKSMIVDTAFFILQQPIDDKGRKFIFAPIKQVESHSFQENNTQQSRHKLGW